MARNILRDEINAGKRKEQLLFAGFTLFSSQGIENVSLQSVADAANVGIATLYKYYKNKNNLLDAISAEIWVNICKKKIKEYGEAFLENKNAYELTELYCDSIIHIYEDTPEILRFSGNFKTYLTRMGRPHSEFPAYSEAVKPLDKLFHNVFEKSVKEGIIRSDISETEMFLTAGLTMLCMAERYALGVVWQNGSSENFSKGLQNVKEMLLAWIKGN